jgi:CRP/FNR family transcriptional regulator, anaerobic regulatory protein
MLNNKQPFTNINYQAINEMSAFIPHSINNPVCDDPEFKHLFSSKSVHYPAKNIIYNEGAIADTVTIIRSGMVKLVSHLPNGRARIVRVHSIGSWLGLCGLLGKPYEHTAIAVDDVEAYYVPVDRLLRVKSENPSLYHQLLEHWYDYLQAADLWIAGFSTGIIKARVARLVNFLSDIEGNEEPTQVKLLTCEEMAEILGATPESVSRVLAEFKRKKVLYPSRFSTGGYCYQRNVTELNAIAQQ